MMVRLKADFTEKVVWVRLGASLFLVFLGGGSKIKTLFELIPQILKDRR